MNNLTSRKEYLYLEKNYPHIARNIRILWSSDETIMLEYTQGLIRGTRNDTRQGFDTEAVNSILRLWLEHSQHPKIPVF